MERDWLELIQTLAHINDNTRLEGITYGGEDVNYMELGSNPEEIPIKKDKGCLQ